MGQVKNGSDKLLVFYDTYTLPSDTSTSWGSISGCLVLPMETSCTIDRSYETEEIQYKASLNVGVNSGQSTVKDTNIKSIKYTVSGSCYAPASSENYSITIDQLRWLADHATTAAGVKKAAIISRPASVTVTSSTTADQLVAQWCPGLNGPDICVPVRVASFSEPSEAGTLVKCDITLEQAGEIEYGRNMTAADWDDLI